MTGGAPVCVCGSADVANGLEHSSGCEVYWAARAKAERDAERVAQLEAVLRRVAALIDGVLGP